MPKGKNRRGAPEGSIWPFSGRCRTNWLYIGFGWSERFLRLDVLVIARWGIGLKTDAPSSWLPVAGGR